MCPFCRASNVNQDRAWYDCSPGAGWRSTVWTHSTYLSHLLVGRLPIPSFFNPVRGIIGLRLENVMVDILHTLDLGISAHIVGSVMFVFACIRKAFGGNRHVEGATRIAAHLKEWYKRTNCHSRIKGKLTLQRLKADKAWAKLKAHGAATRALAPYALALLREFGDVDCPRWGYHDRLATAVCQLLKRFYDIVSSEGSFLNDRIKDELQTLSSQFVVLYCKLARWSLDRKLKIYKMAPKLHLFEHMISQTVQFGNPAYWWTYADEDLVGRLIRTAHTVHPNTIAESMLCKWVHCVFDDLCLDLDADTWSRHE